MSTEIETGPDEPSVAADVKRSAGHVHHEREVEWEGEQHVYEPHRIGLPPLGPYVRELWRRRELAFELSRTTLQSQHFDTVFGKAWLVLNPLMLALVYFVLVDILRRGHNQPGFFAHPVAGVFAYYFVSGAGRGGGESIVKGGRPVVETAFPPAPLPPPALVTGLS